ncbi:trigger factor [Deinococcota bacterium DY0809b]
MAEILEQSGAGAKVRVEVPAEQVEKTTRELLNAYRRRLKVPGFRPGKAPDKVILARVGEEAFWDEVRERLIEASYPEAVRELGLAAIAARLVEGREAPLAGAPYAYTVEVELYPEVELPDWKGFELGVEKPEVTEAMVDEAIEDLRRRYAEVQTVEREVQEGDHVVVEVDDGSRFPIELDRAEPHVREALLGKKAGDSFEIPVMSEEGEVVRQVPTRLIEVKEVRLPELDEEFAKTLEAENLDDLRAKVQRSLEAAAERDHLEAKKQALLEKLAEALEVEVPPTMIRDEERAVLRDVEEDLQRQGIPLADYLKGLEREGKLEEFQADLRKQAEMRVRRGLALEKLSEDLGTQVTDEEWDAYLKSYAERYGLKVPEFKQAVGEEALENLKLRLLRDKALTEAAAQLA